uniref:Polyprotein protein n=1 Tax=Solanum tuberosum TaxID=4113 RepID=M1DCX3_SOLTU
MQAELGKLRADVDNLRSTDISMLWPLRDVPILMPSTMTRSDPSQSVQLSDEAKRVVDVDVDDVDVEDERVDDDLAQETDEEELKTEEDAKMIALTLTELQDT